jgi:flagellar basal body-associated protein FliL
MTTFPPAPRRKATVLALACMLFLPLAALVAITAWPSSTALAQTAPAESASAAATASSATVDLATRVADLGIGRERS